MISFLLQHFSSFNAQRYGDGPEDELPLESNGDYTRKIGLFSNYSNGTKFNKSSENLLNNVW
ncbi:Uncharacterized protein TCM_008225 [Theobroma cacao]|uniref:Uncharacterized protein n=1 Tax=Theobroma cacao TaxID=3641 RepID=A0A061E3J2_THECC|nr:Uncharacterized protein TCM_008225 [Theobroma cacao]